MRSVQAVIEELLVAMILGEKVFTSRKSRVEKVLTFSSLGFAILAVLVAIQSLERFLEMFYVQDVAALITSAVLFAIAIFFTAIASWVRRQTQAHALTTSDALRKFIRTFGNEFLAEFDHTVQADPKMALLLSALAGYLVTPIPSRH